MTNEQTRVTCTAMNGEATKSTEYFAVVFSCYTFCREAVTVSRVMIQQQGLVLQFSVSFHLYSMNAKSFWVAIDILIYSTACR